MNQDTFTEERKEKWQALDTFLKKAEGDGIKNFSADEIKLLGSLYRKVCSDLSYARSKKYSLSLIRYLNHLARRAYGLIYLEDREKEGRIINFFIKVFPELFRQNIAFINAAIIIFIISFLTGYLWDAADPRFARSIVPLEILEIWDGRTEGVPLSATAFPVMSSWYLTHNFKVGIMAFVLGIFMGIGTLYLLVHNGLITGALFSLVARSGNFNELFSFVISHVFIELLAIFICAGAGFMVARALIYPGDFYVSDALNYYGKPAVSLVLGTIPLFLLAGIIESLSLIHI